MTEFRFPPFKIGPSAEEVLLRAHSSDPAKPGACFPSFGSRGINRDRIAWQADPQFRKVMDAIREYGSENPAPLHPAEFSSPATPKLGPADEMFNVLEFKTRLSLNILFKYGLLDYAFVIFQNGVEAASYASGSARGFVSPVFNMSADQPVNVASVAKIITGAAIAQALHKHPTAGFTSKIKDFMPPTWKTKSAVVDGLTIKDCLQYRVGGLNDGSGGTDIAKVKAWYVDGTFPGFLPLSPVLAGPNAPRRYNNVCIVWLKFVLFYLTATDDIRKVAAIFNNNTPMLNSIISDYYVAHVRKNLFAPVGIQWADMSPISAYDSRPSKVKQDTQTIYFTSVGNHMSGKPCADWTDYGGAGGWILSARSLARFWAAFRAGKYGPHWNLFLNYGLPAESYICVSDREIVPMSKKGIFLGKMGGATESGNIGYFAEAWDFPASSTQLAFVSNTRFTPQTFRDQIVIPSYNSSWFPKFP